MTCPAARRSTRSYGFTLVEVIVVLGVLAMGAALTVPTLVQRREADRTLGQLVRDSRRTAIARSQPLLLAVDATGRWTLTSVREGHPISRGALDEPVPATGARIAFSPSGSCVLRSAVPPGWNTWDAARCTSRSLP